MKLRIVQRGNIKEVGVKKHRDQRNNARALAQDPTPMHTQTLKKINTVSQGNEVLIAKGCFVVCSLTMYGRCIELDGQEESSFVLI